MNKISTTDYLIELTELRGFVNEQIEDGSLDSVQGMIVFKSLKDAVIGAEIKPFVQAPAKGQSSSYYEKYYKAEHHPEYAIRIIPDFFSSGYDFYDLGVILNIKRNKTRTESFKILFLLKLYLLEKTETSINGFLDFQVHDNFNGDKENLNILLYQFLENDGISCLLPETIAIINNWINNKEIITTDSNKTKEKSKENIITSSEKSISNLNAEIEIKGHFSIEEIRKYFSFLYEETSANNKPFLRKEEVEEILKNGFKIPSKPIEPKYKLNVNPKYPRSIIDYAIQTLYFANNIYANDRKLYLQFLGHYIQDYQAVIESPERCKSFLSNFSGALTSRNKIKWDKYLPERRK